MRKGNKRKHKYKGYKIKKSCKRGDLPEYTGTMLEVKKDNKTWNSIVTEGTKTESGKIMTNRVQTVKKYHGQYSNGMIRLGSVVTLKSLDSKEILTYELVTTNEINIFKNKISEDSNLGRCLLGKYEGNVIKVPTPSGESFYLIMTVK